MTMTPGPATQPRPCPNTKAEINHLVLLILTSVLSKNLRAEIHLIDLHGHFLQSPTWRGRDPPNPFPLHGVLRWLEHSAGRAARLQAPGQAGKQL